MSVVVEDLTVRYGGVTAADNVALEIERGQVVGLIGPNGSGKTTVVNAMTGFAPKAAGTVTLDERDLTRRSPAEVARSGVRRTFQGARCFPWLTLQEHLQVTWQDAAATDDAVALTSWVIGALGLSGVLSGHLQSLPYGTQRNVGLLLAVAGGPAYILLDEPASGLHEREIVRVADVIERLSAEGVGVLLIDHNIGFVRKVTDQLVVMNAGATLERGSTPDVLASRSVQEVYLGTRR